MKTLVATVAFAIAFTAVPAFIQSATAAESREVFVGGKYIGQDPDANVRLQLRRDAGSENF
jgi:hypothetical protein